MGRSGDDDLRGAFAALARGEIDALSTVWQGVSSPLHHYAFALTGDQDEADDVLAEAMIRLARQGWRLRWVRNPRAYLFAAVRNLVRSHARRADVAQAHLRDRPPASDQAEEIAVREAVLGLPAEQREVVVLHIWGGLTFEEIGQLVGTPLNTAASRYRYALAKLRQALGEGDDERRGPEEEAGRDVAQHTGRHVA